MAYRDYEKRDTTFLLTLTNREFSAETERIASIIVITSVSSIINHLLQNPQTIFKARKIN